jgi:predicted RecA/RadA family phage recombinase
MSQVPAVRWSEGDMIDHTPGSAVAAGDVVVLGSIPLVAPLDIAAGVLGALATRGVFKVPKATGAFAAGDAVYWAAAGNPNTGTAGTGAATSTASGNNLMGLAVLDAASGDDFVYVLLTAAKRTTTLGGSVTADDITGSDASLGVTGLAAAQGGAVALAGGTSSTSGNAGGAVSLTGGTPGATGVGGAASVTGGIGGSTSGTGGAVTIAGGAGTAGNANGGALTLRGGAKNGSGTDGAIAIGDANTASVTFGKMPRIPTGTVAAAGSVQGDAAALAEGFNLVTAADDTKGVLLPSAVAGMVVIVKSSVSNKILKVWPATGDAINAIAANSAMSLASGPTVAMFVAYDATTWYSLPLLPS